MGFVLESGDSLGGLILQLIDSFDLEVRLRFQLLVVILDGDDVVILLFQLVPHNPQSRFVVVYLLLQLDLVLLLLL